MSQALHDPSIDSICFNLLYFHWKVNTFKTPKMCLYLDSEVWAGWFTIIFTRSFPYFKPVSCRILVCQNVTGIPRPFDQLPSRMGKVNTFKMRLYFDSDVCGGCLNYFCWIFSLVEVFYQNKQLCETKVAGQRLSSSRLFWLATGPYWQHWTHLSKKSYFIELKPSSRAFPSSDQKLIFVFIPCFLLGEFLRTGISYKTLASLGRDARRHYLKVGY